MNTFEQSALALKQSATNSLKKLETTFPESVGHLAVARAAVEDFCNRPLPTDFDGMSEMSMEHVRLKMTLDHAWNSLARKTLAQRLANGSN